MRCLFRSLILQALVCVLSAVVQAAESKSLQIFFIDVEGGQATLIVTPSKQSILIDTGWPGFNGRDAGRIVAAAKAAGVDQIDYVVITHFHRDHVGGVIQLASQIKIGTFVDHGPNMEDAAASREDFAAYEKVAASSKRLIVKPGDQIPMKDIDVRVLTTAGERISVPLEGAGQSNPLCASEPEAAVDSTENARSLGTLITFGKFRFLDLGDLTKRKEKDLVCPNNLIGAVDLYLTTQHGVNQSPLSQAGNQERLVAMVTTMWELYDAYSGTAATAYDETLVDLARRDERQRTLLLDDLLEFAGTSGFVAIALRDGLGQGTQCFRNVYRERG